LNDQVSLTLWIAEPVAAASDAVGWPLTARRWPPAA